MTKQESTQRISHTAPPFFMVSKIISPKKALVSAKRFTADCGDVKYKTKGISIQCDALLNWVFESVRKNEVAKHDILKPGTINGNVVPYMDENGNFADDFVFRKVEKDIDEFLELTERAVTEENRWASHSEIDKLLQEANETKFSWKWKLFTGETRELLNVNLIGPHAWEGHKLIVYIEENYMKALSRSLTSYPAEYIKIAFTERSFRMRLLCRELIEGKRRNRGKYDSDSRENHFGVRALWKAVRYPSKEEIEKDNHGAKRQIERFKKDLDKIAADWSDFDYKFFRYVRKPGSFDYKEPIRNEDTPDNLDEFLNLYIEISIKGYLLSEGRKAYKEKQNKLAHLSKDKKGEVPRRNSRKKKPEPKAPAHEVKEIKNLPEV